MEKQQSEKGAAPTEIPLNARRLSEQIWRRRFGDCTSELSWDEWLEMSQEMARWVLAEAERALRERGMNEAANVIRESVAS